MALAKSPDNLSWPVMNAVAGFSSPEKKRRRNVVDEKCMNEGDGFQLPENARLKKNYEGKIA